MDFNWNVNMNFEIAVDSFRPMPTDRHASGARADRFVRKYGALFCALPRKLADWKDRNREIGNGTSWKVNNRALEGENASLSSCFSPRVGPQNENSALHARDFILHSFSIKNHENSPWNALDLCKIAGLCCIQLKLQLWTKRTLHR
jgi:hypothetical protein